MGAFARDLNLLYRYGIQTKRETEDIDFALAVPHWDTGDALKRKLTASGDFSESKSPQRMRYRNQLPVDLVPFGKVEAKEGKIAWPPHGEVVMDVWI
ncbi:MAG: hypothetical protein ABI580_11980 [Burkholderiaceae bacterium]